MNSDNVVALQWAAVGTLRENEAYAVTIVDFTDGGENKLVEYVTDTKFIVPLSMLPAEAAPHVFRWWVLTVRQIGTDESGNPIWEAAGSPSVQRIFVWAGSSTAVTPTP